MRIALMGLLVVGLLMVGATGCYEMVPAHREGMAYRINKITGTVSICAILNCREMREGKSLDDGS